MLNNSNNFNHPVKWVEPSSGSENGRGGDELYNRCSTVMRGKTEGAKHCVGGGGNVSTEGGNVVQSGTGMSILLYSLYSLQFSLYGDDTN